MLSREYMADRDFMVSHSPAEREWYLLTSMFADDGGYLQWDLPDNAANLYRYEIPAEREARVAGYVARLTATSRFQDLGCGRHAVMPRVAKRPRGRAREHRVQEEHGECVQSAFEQHSQSTDSAAGIETDSTHTANQSVLFRSVPIHSVPPAPARANDGAASAADAAAPSLPNPGTKSAKEILDETWRRPSKGSA
jgi:hypothetical protein